jgi:hypothetical protein
MCRLASFVVTREKVLWHPSDDSHEKIISHYHLDDKRESNFVRVEMVPPNGDYFKPFSEWKFCIDQDKIPEWFSKKVEEDMVRAELPKWKKKRQFFYDAMEFVKTIKDVPYFSGKGKILKAWKVFPTRAAARDAAGAAAQAAAADAAGDATWDVAGDAEVLSQCIIVADRLDLKHMKHARARWDVWQRGYGLLCDVNGVLYVYKKP